MGARILIIDDQPLNAELAEYILTRAGHEVQVAQSAAQGFESIAAIRPDLILMDIQMPDLDGLEMTRRLKADETTRNILVVAFTAYAMKGDEERMRAAGCDGYLAKPIDVKTFADRVAGWLIKRP